MSNINVLAMQHGWTMTGWLDKRHRLFRSIFCSYGPKTNQETSSGEMYLNRHTFGAWLGSHTPYQPLIWVNLTHMIQLKRRKPGTHVWTGYKMYYWKRWYLYCHWFRHSILWGWEQPVINKTKNQHWYRYEGSFRRFVRQSRACLHLSWWNNAINYAIWSTVNN